MGYFYFFDEWAMDPKVQSIPEQFRSRLVSLFCLRNIGPTSDMTDDEMSVFFRIALAETRKTKEIFRNQGFINGDGWNVKNWEKRQSGHCESYDRVRRFRAKPLQRNVTETLQSNGDDSRVTLHCNVTSRVRDNELTNELTNKEIKKEEPRKRGKPSATADDCSLPTWLPKDELNAWLQHRKEIGHPVKPTSLAAVVNKLRRFKEAGHNPLEILEASIVGGYQGLFAPSMPKNGKPDPKPPEPIYDPEKGREAMAKCLAAAEQARLEGLARKAKNEHPRSKE